VARWRNLLGGPFYVELDTGSPSTGVDRSGLIPTSRTKAQVNFDQLLQPLDGRTAPALRTLVDQLGEGLAAPGAIRRDFRLLSPTMRSVRPGLAALEGERNDDLRELIRSTAKTVAGLGSDEDRLRALVDSAAGTFGATAARREDLGRLIADAPATLASTLTTVRRIDATLRHLDPLAEELRPGARRLEPALRVAQRTFIEAPRLLAEAEPLLRALDPALDSLERASRTGRGVVTGAKPIVARVDDRMLPWLARRDEGTGFRNVDILGPTFGGVNAAGAEFDREGHFLRFAPGAAPERPALSSPCQTFLGDPTAEQIVRCDALNQALDQIFGGPGRR
jgi:ABC-type transporter Mla subunit MlaD